MSWIFKNWPVLLFISGDADHGHCVAQISTKDSLFCMLCASPLSFRNRKSNKEWIRVAREESGNRSLTNNEKQLIVYMTSLQQEEEDSELNLCCASWLTNAPQSLKQTKLCLWVQIPAELFDELSTLLRDKGCEKGSTESASSQNASSIVVLFLSIFFFHLGYERMLLR